MIPKFERDSLTQIFSEKKLIIDIGGSLRLDASRNNRSNDPNNAYLMPFLKTVEYKVLDKVADYNPDIVGDIHELPLEDNSVDAIICVSILEHVEDPWKAMREMYRVLKPGGYLYLYVPFLFYYHPEKGYYEDFFRFTRDGVKLLAKDFTKTEISTVYGAVTTAMNLFPFFTKNRLGLFQFIDKIVKKDKSDQTSGYMALCTK